VSDEYLVERTFYDITVTTGLTAGSTLRLDSTGSSQGVSYMTPNTVITSATGRDVVREITSVEVIPPVNSQGQYEDLREIRFVLDNQPYAHYITLPGCGWNLMTAQRDHIWGGDHFQVLLGEPLWRVIRNKVRNMPLRAVAPKYTDRLGIELSTVYGVTGAFRIIVKGYEYTASQLTALAKDWNGSVNYQTLRRQVEGRPALQMDLQYPPLSLQNFGAYPGGVRQGTPKIGPYWHFAFNAQATPNSNVYPFSDLSEVGGSSGNVEDEFQDLGIATVTSSAAFILHSLGIRPMPPLPGQSGSWTPGQNLIRAGIRVNGTNLPTEQGSDGIFLTPGQNPLEFGALQPNINLPNVWRRMPSWRGELLIYGQPGAGETFVPFVGANGSAIPADAVVAAITGVIVEGV